MTGAASGIGLALAAQCLERGMRVVMADVDSEQLAEQLAERPTKKLAEQPAKARTGLRAADAHSRIVDVSDAHAVEALAEATFREFGQVNLLFNNAGVLDVGLVWERSSEVAERLLRVNVLGVMHGLHSFVPRMIAQGSPAHIVNTASVGAIICAPMLGLYTASKMAVRGLTETLRLELREQGAPIGVSMLCPGPVATAMTRPAREQASHRAARTAAVAGMDYMDPREVAEITFEAIVQERFWIFTHPELVDERMLSQD